MINIVMLLAGGGSRFKDKHVIPKPMIDVHGEPMYLRTLEYFLKNHNLEAISNLYFVLKSEDTSLKRHIEERFPKSRFCILEKQTSGALESLKFGVESVQSEDSIISLDCDLFVKSEEFKEYIHSNKSSDNSGLVVFDSSNPAYSYIRNDENGNISIEEKKVISNQAIAGAYLLPSKNVILPIINEVLNNIEKEPYVSDLYRFLVSRKTTLSVFKSQKHISFGTSEELNDNLKKIAHEIE